MSPKDRRSLVKVFLTAGEQPVSATSDWEVASRSGGNLSVLLHAPLKMTQIIAETTWTTLADTWIGASLQLQLASCTALPSAAEDVVIANLGAPMSQR
jgi:hypothetical protein